MVEVGQRPGVGSEDLADLQGDPFGSVAHGVDGAVQAAPGFFGDVAPSVSGFLHAAKGGGVFALHAALALCGDEPDFLPRARARTPAGALFPTAVGPSRKNGALLVSSGTRSVSRETRGHSILDVGRAAGAETNFLQ